MKAKKSQTDRPPTDLWVLAESHEILRNRENPNVKKKSIKTSTEIAVEKVLTQLIANYDPHDSLDSAPQIRIICAKPKHFGGTHYLLPLNYVSFKDKNLEVHSAKLVDAEDIPGIDLGAGDLAANQAPGACSLHLIGGGADSSHIHLYYVTRDSVNEMQ